MATPSKSQNSTAIGGRRSAKDGSSTDASPARSATPTTGKNASTPVSSVARTKSVRTHGAGTPVSARAAVRRPPNGSSNATNAPNGAEVVDNSDADSKAQATAVIEELQDSLRLSQETSEEHQRHIVLLKARAEDWANEHRKLEEHTQELTERLEELENEKRDSLRSKRELEAVYESDRLASLKSKEEAQAREEELTATIQRLKDSLSQREFRTGTDEGKRPDISRTASFRSANSPQVENAHFAPSSSLQRSDSRSSSRLVLQKDKIIESLRIELAEAQIRLVEMENMGGGQVQELERNLMETRMTNARLMEENESFQLLLSEKTLTGELGNSGILQKVDIDATPTTAAKGSSLEEELQHAEVDGEDNATKGFKLQIASLRDENKALTLYINNIISRLLQHDFEFILDKNAEATANKPSARPTDKDLPPPPPAKGEDAPGFLARTRSMMGVSRPRPQSAIFSSDVTTRSTPHENPDTAPSIPIGRQPRSTSGGGQRHSVADWNSAAVVNSMYRGPSPTRSSGGALSPSIASPRNSYFAPRPSNAARAPSGSNVGTINENEKSPHKINRDSKIGSSRNSLASDTSNSISPPQSTVGSNDKATNSVMVGSKMRPLRLVQENADETAARKAANRTSWMGWFNKGT
ncbi:hypothetical protein ANO11243_037590 [Dothideomycetidae sp. 11243]|nr:hypothetical protein ANO11243_037590 [fungal sp. No.11243]